MCAGGRGGVTNREGPSRTRGCWNRQYGLIYHNIKFPSWRFVPQDDRWIQRVSSKCQSRIGHVTNSSFQYPWSSWRKLWIDEMYHLRRKEVNWLMIKYQEMWCVAYVINRRRGVRARLSSLRHRDWHPTSITEANNKSPLTQIYKCPAMHLSFAE